MRKTILFSGSALAAACLAPWLAQAQPASGTTQSQATQARGAGAGMGQQANRPRVAEACMRDLTAFSEKMDKDGYWLSGYRRGYGWNMTGRMGMDGARPGVAATGPNNPASNDAGSGRAASGTGTTNRAAGNAASTTNPPSAPGTGPWGNVAWRTPPAQELGTLYRAAGVLAHRGEEQACQTVLGEARNVYTEYSGQLREAGVQPGQMVTYRQQQLAAARPVSEMQRSFRADNITGTDVRNPKDDYLGSVEDVLVNPANGQISYVILSRGGFLGVGEDYVAIPWARLSATPNMDSFVVKASEDMLDKAPKVDPDTFASNQGQNGRRQEIDTFWQQNNGG